MHTRRFSMLILGIWVGLTFAMWFVATQNFRGVDRLLEEPAAAARKTIQQLDYDQSRTFLRYQISELNRFDFDWYGTAQLILVLLLAVTLFFATTANKVTMAMAGALFIVVMVENHFLLPEIVFLGRLIDFVPVETISAARSRFWSFHNIYSGVEVFKLILFAALSLKMIAKSPPRTRIPRTNDLVQETLELR